MRNYKSTIKICEECGKEYPVKSSVRKSIKLPEGFRKRNQPTYSEACQVIRRDKQNILKVRRYSEKLKLKMNKKMEKNNE